jgi:hypothetical protein
MLSPQHAFAPSDTTNISLRKRKRNKVPTIQYKYRKRPQSASQPVEPNHSGTILEFLTLWNAQAINRTRYDADTNTSATEPPTLINLSGYDFEPCDGITDRAIEYLISRT